MAIRTNHLPLAGHAGKLRIVPSSVLLNAGIYTIPEAARLTRVSPSRIWRWLRGYDFRTRKGAKAHSDPAWSVQLEPLEGKIAIGFYDLMEIRYGQPSAAESGVPTRVLARSAKTNGSLEAVSRWFEVSMREVQDAVDFETQLVA